MLTCRTGVAEEAYLIQIINCSVITMTIQKLSSLTLAQESLFPLSQAVSSPYSTEKGKST